MHAISPTPSTAALTPAARRCIERYKSPENFLALFEPRNQYAYTLDLKRVFTGNAPSLGAVSKAWGANITESWLAIQLIDLSEFSGCKDKLSTFQLSNIAKVIMASWGYFKVTEMMLFFLQFKSGKFGKFYGAVDGLAITEALHDFNRERCQIIDRYRREEETRLRKQQEEASEIVAAEFLSLCRQARMRPTEFVEFCNRYDMPPAEAAEIGWLFNLGYEPKQINSK